MKKLLRLKARLCSFHCAHGVCTIYMSGLYVPSCACPLRMYVMSTSYVCRACSQRMHVSSVCMFLCINVPSCVRMSLNMCVLSVRISAPSCICPSVCVSLCVPMGYMYPSYQVYLSSEYITLYLTLYTFHCVNCDGVEAKPRNR